MSEYRWLWTAIALVFLIDSVIVIFSGNSIRGFFGYADQVPINERIIDGIIRLLISLGIVVCLLISNKKNKKSTPRKLK